MEPQGVAGAPDACDLGADAAGGLGWWCGYGGERPVDQCHGLDLEWLCAGEADHDRVLCAVMVEDARLM